MTKADEERLRNELATAHARIADLEQRPTSVVIHTHPEPFELGGPRVTVTPTLVVQIVSPDGHDLMTITTQHATIVRRTT
jgi:hypothetical protein